MSGRDGGAGSQGAPERWRALRASAALYAAVVAGGILGSLARWLVTRWFPETWFGIPWPTFFANVTGCLVIGFYAELTGPGGRLFAGARARQFVMTGICGGYTTFSGFSLEMLQFLQDGDLRSAVIYLAVSLVGWLAAVWLGEALADWINR
jgi:CrcB protein